MDGKGSISDYRSKMDRTLASPDLTNHGKLQTLVKNQILKSSEHQFEGDIENVVERRSNEVSNFLSMLRSTTLVNDVGRSESNDDSRPWKVKQDTEECRVMYREGPEGTPFHTLLVEGYVDGPLDVCLCISWESALYNRWWPQTAIPTFKVISSRCLQRVGDGEQISLVRMKVSWPLSSREAVIHYFAFEYFQDGLIVVLLNSISDSETVERQSHGFTRDERPDMEEVVRMDVVGGFALQKVTADRSYFRTIANVDIKLDFVPPSFINFVSRQLVGSGFKLYKKEVASVSRGDEKFCEALKDPLYSRIRMALDSESSTRPQVVEDDQKRNAFSERTEEEKLEELQENKTQESETLDSLGVKSSSEEEEGPSTDKAMERCRNETRKKVVMNPEVEKALVILEKAITIYKEKSMMSGLNSENDDQNIRNYSESLNVQMHNLASVEETTISLENHASSSSSSSRRETNHSKIVPSNCELQKVESGWKSLNKSKDKKHRLCCLHFIYQY